ncbi:uncharacterized protein LOC129905905 isoform X2 [Episyrphus balteatus]|uniref:uncharacterized protein LOC129905905 isoform X2 n=1 Tax=Episyrphus balteatus TaxID=286459 RepID=UPI00248671CC|nr:uncharacterized protein LOC129905905 isoform X2 [Episyrphus balteatus]XP_055837509.1 uncharacterized protein LOC129905905 isoform X2 [Episyrphus balteatus]
MEKQIVHEETLIDRDVEVGSGLGSMINSGKFEMPSMDDIMKLIDSMKDISDEERENLKSSIMFPDAATTDKMRQQFEAANQIGPSSIDYFLFMAMVGLIALVFALFGYKLYKSLMEKEHKKQEKQKNNKKSKKIKQK